MSRRSKIWFFPWCLVVLLAASAELQARRMFSGHDIPDRFVFPNDPAVKSGPRISKELLPVGLQFITGHCYLINDDNSVGRVTLFGISQVAMKFLPVSAFKGKLTEQQLAINVNDNVSGANLLLSYALKVSGGDARRAMIFVKAAEKHDAECLRQHVRYSRTSIELYKIGGQLGLDASGQWVVLRDSTKQFLHLIPGRIDELKQLDYLATVATFGYKIIYQKLEERAAATRPKEEKMGMVAKSAPMRKPQPKAGSPEQEKLPPRVVEQNQLPVAPPVLAATTASTEAVKELAEAQSELQAVIAQAKQFCLLKALPSCG